MSQTVLIDAFGDSANIPKVRLKTHLKQQQKYCMPTKKASNDNNLGIIHQPLDN
jgi:hypothetical protein